MNGEKPLTTLTGRPYALRRREWLSWFLLLAPSCAVLLAIASGLWRPRYFTWRLTESCLIGMPLSGIFATTFYFAMRTRIEQTDSLPCLHCAGATLADGDAIRCMRCGTAARREFAHEVWSALLPGIRPGAGGPPRHPFSPREAQQRRKFAVTAGSMLIFAAVVLAPLFFFSVPMGLIGVGAPLAVGVSILLQDRADLDQLRKWDDRICLECGYSLRGLEDRRCPECGVINELADESAVAPAERPRESWHLWRRIGIALFLLTIAGCYAIVSAEAACELYTDVLSLPRQMPLWRELRVDPKAVRSTVKSNFQESLMDHARWLPRLMIGTSVVAVLTTLVMLRFLREARKARTLRDRSGRANARPEADLALPGVLQRDV